MTRTTPYRIAVWGTGDVAGVCIREAIRRPDLEVVGAYVYNEKKDDVDIGTIVGKDPIGVKATRDLKKFLAIDCDVVLYTALDIPGGPAEQDFITLLKAGKNVITSLPYSYLPARDKKFGDALTAAAEEGGATFYATGVNPDFIGHRYVLLQTGLSSEVDSIKIEEYFDCVDQVNTSTLEVIGLGGDPALAGDPNSPAMFYQRQYWFQMIQHMADSMGVELSRIEAACYCEPAPVDIEAANMKIPKGRTGSVAYESTGYVGDTPFIVMRVGWYMTSLMKPKHAGSDTEWIITIEGRPSSRCVLSVAPSFLSDSKIIDGDPAAPGYFAFGICLLQGIPATVEHPPGIKKTDLPPIHWRRDLRLITPSNEGSLGKR
jgi:hypothetical protein